MVALLWYFGILRFLCAIGCEAKKMGDNLVLVVDEAKNLITNDEGLVLAQNQVDHSLQYIHLPEEIIRNVNVQSPNNASSEEPELTSPEPSVSKEKLKKWTRRATLLLIDLRKKNETLFQSTTMKNDKVWGKICSELEEQGIYCTPAQCRDRWKYLRQKYTEKKDNKGARCTGAGPVHFEFFDELDSFLGKKHAFIPMVASSLEGTPAAVATTAHHEEALEDEFPDDMLPDKPEKQVSLKRKRGKEDPVKKMIEAMYEQSKKRDEERKKRHEETLAARERATDVFASKFDALLEKLSK